MMHILQQLSIVGFHVLMLLAIIIAIRSESD